MGIFEKFKIGFKRSASNIASGLKEIIVKKEIDDTTLDKIEEFLIGSDVGIDAASEIKSIIAQKKIDPKNDPIKEVFEILNNYILELMKPLEKKDFFLKKEKTNIILVSGVNGVGKTTTIGKLGKIFIQNDNKVLFSACDTFRAAAIDQLVTWAERVDVPIVKQQMGSDPASVAFDTLNFAKSNNADVVLIDTAGRLHNKVNLMNELSKIKRVMDKVIDNAPHDVMLVLDGSTGQNAFIQAKEFTNVTEVSSLAITKLDGTAKGGVVIGISDEFKIPVKYIGVGEGLEDLQDFDKLEFVDSFFD